MLKTVTMAGRGLETHDLSSGGCNAGSVVMHAQRGNCVRVDRRAVRMVKDILAFEVQRG